MSFLTAILGAYGGYGQGRRQRNLDDLAAQSQRSNQQYQTQQLSEQTRVDDATIAGQRAKQIADNRANGLDENGAPLPMPKFTGAANQTDPNNGGVVRPTTPSMMASFYQRRADAALAMNRPDLAQFYQTQAKLSAQDAEQSALAGLNTQKTVTEADKIREFNAGLDAKKSALQATLGERWGAVQAQIAGRADVAHYNAAARQQIAILAGNNAMARAQEQAKAAMARTQLTVGGADIRSANSINAANARDAANQQGADYRAQYNDYVRSYLNIQDQDVANARNVYDQQQDDLRKSDIPGVPIDQSGVVAPLAPQMPAMTFNIGQAPPQYSFPPINSGALPPLPPINTGGAPPPPGTPTTTKPTNGLNPNNVAFTKEALLKLGAAETRKRLMAKLGMTQQQADAYIQAAGGVTPLPPGGMRQVLAPQGGSGPAGSPFSIAR